MWSPNDRIIRTLHMCILILLFNIHQFCFVWIFKGFIICYQDNEDRIFKKFWTQFLPLAPFPTALDSKQPSDVRLLMPSDVRLLMVFILPSVNRQNNVEVLCSYISKLKKKYHLDGTCVFCVIKIKIMFIVNSHINQYIQNTM